MGKIDKIRKIRADLNAIGLKSTAVNDELTEQITTTVNEVVEETTARILVNYPGSADRRNELGNALRQDTHRLFGQIERGLKVEFRAAPQENGDAKEQKDLADISALGRSMQFPEIAQQPMLLNGSEILEGEIQTVKVSKKTTTEKTTVKRKMRSMHVSEPKE